MEAGREAICGRVTKVTVYSVHVTVENVVIK
jgi:hypothetical protein